MSRTPKTLHAWLVQTKPNPPKVLRHTDSDGKEQRVGVGKTTRWTVVEKDLRNLGEGTVSCVDKEGALVEGGTFNLDPNEDDDAEDKLGKAADHAVTRSQRETAGMLDAYGMRLNQAFDRGSAAAGSSQDKLIELVEVLTSNLAMAINNINALSLNLAQQIQATAHANSAGGEEGGNSALVGQFLGAVMSGKLGPAPAGDAVNGKGKK